MAAWQQLTLGAVLFALLCGGAEVRGQCGPTELGKLIASDAAASDSFSWSIALDGDTALVGAYLDDHTAGTDAGAAYVFVRAGGVWTQQAKLTASDAAQDDNFAVGVGLSGNTAVIGARQNDPGGLSNAGAAYVFVRSGGLWTQQAKLVASDRESGDYFGARVAISGDTVVVGAVLDNLPGGFDQGSAYVFVRNGTTWTEQARLTASDAATSDRFGDSVALSGDSALIGASADDHASATDAGSAYVFVRSGSTWSQQAKLVASDAASSDLFGSSTGISMDTAIIGAHGDDHAGGVNAGSAYVFTRTGSIWTEQTRLMGSDTVAGDEFGVSVGITGNTALVGAWLDDHPGLGSNPGSAYLFNRTGGVWSERTKLTASDAAAGDWFGHRVALSADTALIGALADDHPGANDAGSAYVFAPTPLLEPTPYLCSADSPFDLTGGQFYLENFEDGQLNTPGVTATGAFVLGPGPNTDSVDCDDGTINGSGTGGRSFIDPSIPLAIRFTFSAAVLGDWPTHAGVVWTDGGFGGNPTTVTFEAFDGQSVSLGTITRNLGDNTNDGTTAEDRFLGVIHAAGVSAIEVRQTAGGLEVDHLLYGNAPTVWYVNDYAPPGGNGRCWGGAFRHLQDALAAATPGSEIWVAAGTYRPDEFAANPSGTGDRNATFQLMNDVGLYGGFNGSEVWRAQRDPSANLSVLSGDLNGDDGPSFTNYGDNAYHVATGSGTSGTAILDGFEIIGGNAIDGGGGIYLQNSTSVIRRCFFGGNSGNTGGAILADNSNFIVEDCGFVRNAAKGGAGILNRGSSPTVTRCQFEANSASLGDPGSGGGGGMLNSAGSNPLVTDCLFVGNVTTGSGGGLYNTASNPTVQNCTFLANMAPTEFIAESGAGAIANSGSNSTIADTVIWGNAASVGPQVLAFDYGGLTIHHSVIEGGRAGVVPFPGRPPATITWGPGNLDIDPKLAPDGHLRAGSPCIDAGDPALVIPPASPTDVDGEPRIIGGRVDMGADEWLNSDGDGLPDWWETQYFGTSTGGDPSADSDSDGLTNLQEYEQYGSHPAAGPIYVCNACDPAPDGTPAHPFATIQDGIDASGEGDTVLVLANVATTYSGARNRNLDFHGRPLTVRKLGSATATINCGGQAPAINPLSISGVFAVLEGFTVRSGQSDIGGAVNAEISRLMLKNCRLELSHASIEAGGLYGRGAAPTLDNVRIKDNTAPAGAADAGVLAGSTAVLTGGGLRLVSGTFELRSSWLDGTGAVTLEEPDSAPRLRIAGTAPGDPPTIVRTNILGTADLVIDVGQVFRVEHGATIDLSGGTGSGCADPSQAVNWGTITVNGTLLVTDGTIQNTNVDVKLANLRGSTVIVNNDIRLVQSVQPGATTAGYGGEFFVEGGSTIQCNRIISEGDRYMDLDPDADNRNLNITSNSIEVIITQGAGGEQGELLELRARDAHCDPNLDSNGCPSGAFALPAGSFEFPNDLAENWVLERLEVRPDAKVNLTNRQGFDFSTNGAPDTIYVKDLVLGPDSVLNLGLQRLYYQYLRYVDSNGMQVTSNGAEIADIPVLSFSLKVIAMQDDTEFDVRVRTRLRDPADDPQPLVPPFKEGAIERIDTNGIGVMDMRTRAEGQLSAASVAAKGAFARAGEDEIVVAFDYLFVRNPAAELVVYLSDDPTASTNGIEIARLEVPPAGRDGSAAALGGTGEFASFYGEFPRGNLNFTRGTYVGLELRGADARVWIDDWDPRIRCSGCADLNGTGGPEGEDYLLLLASFGLDIDANSQVETGEQENADCFDSVLGGDRYVDTGDLLAWDTFLDEDALNACGTGVRRSQKSEVGSRNLLVRESLLEPHFLGFLSHAPVGGKDSPTARPEIGISGQQSPTPKGWGTHSPLTTHRSLLPSDLLVAGKPNGAGLQDDYLYSVDADGACPGGSPLPAASGPGTRGHGGLVTAPDGTLYQLHSTGGVLPVEGGTALIAPATNLTPTSNSSLRVTVGVNDFGGGEFLGLPLADAAFDPTNANELYVLPVLVIPASGLPPCVYYNAAAKLVLSGGGYSVERLYEVPAAERTDPCEPAPPQLDRGEFREIEVSTNGSKVFIASARSDNDNDWLLVFTESSGVLMTSALIGEVPPEGMMPAGLTVAAPLAMLASRVGGTPYLYLAAAVNAAPSETVGSQSVARTRLFRFNVSSGVTFAGALDISNPECVNPYDTLGCKGALTALAENPNDGTLYALGFTSPHFNVDYPYNSPPFGGPNPNQIVIFTTPTLATIPPGATWSMTVPPAPPAAAQATANLVTCADLALPISIAWSPAGCAVAGDMDADGDVQLDDWADFAGCLTGPAGSLGAGCGCADLDADADADLRDLAAFQAGL